MENQALENLLTRRSIRKYSDRPIDDEKLEAILKAATYAPTGMGSQSPVIVLAKTKETVQKLSKMNAKVMGRDMDPFYGAPTVAIVFGNKKSVPTWYEDAALVAGNLLNAAHAVGVDSCYIYRAKEMFESEEGQSLLKEWGLDKSYEGISICLLGYGDGPTPEAKPRKGDYVRIV